MILIITNPKTKLSKEVDTKGYKPNDVLKSYNVYTKAGYTWQIKGNEDA